MRTYNLVGAYFRPPAKSILQVLPGNATLTLRPEPDNPYDPNAIQVCVATSEIPEELHDDLAASIMGYGFTLDEVLTQDEWHLGYIPRTDAVDLALELAGQSVVGRLGFDAKGKPIVTLPDALEHLEAAE